MPLAAWILILILILIVIKSDEASVTMTRLKVLYLGGTATYILAAARRSSAMPN